MSQPSRGWQKSSWTDTGTASTSIIQGLDDSEEQKEKGEEKEDDKMTTISDEDDGSDDSDDSDDDDDEDEEYTEEETSEMRQFFTIFTADPHQQSLPSRPPGFQMPTDQPTTFDIQDWISWAEERVGTLRPGSTFRTQEVVHALALSQSLIALATSPKVAEKTKAHQVKAWKMAAQHILLDQNANQEAVMFDAITSIPLPEVTINFGPDGQEETFVHAFLVALMFLAEPSWQTPRRVAHLPAGEFDTVLGQREPDPLNPEDVHVLQRLFAHPVATRALLALSPKTANSIGFDGAAFRALAMAACGAGSTHVLTTLFEDARFEAELQRHAGVFHQPGDFSSSYGISGEWGGNAGVAVIDSQRATTRWSMDLRYELFLASMASQTTGVLELLNAQFGRRFLANAQFQTLGEWIATGMIPPSWDIEELHTDEPTATFLTANLAGVACKMGYLPGLTWLLDLKRTDNIHRLVSLNSAANVEVLIDPLIQIAVDNSQAEIVNLLMSRSGTAKALEDKIDLQGNVGFSIVGICVQKSTNAVMKALLQQSWPSLSISDRDDNAVGEDGDNRRPGRPDWIDIPALLDTWKGAWRWPFNFTSSSSNDNPMQHLLVVHEAQLKARGLTLPVFVGSFRERAFLNACAQGAVQALDMFMDEVGFNPRGDKNKCVEVIMKEYFRASEQLVRLAKRQATGEEFVLPQVLEYYGSNTVTTRSVIEALPSREQQALAWKKFQNDLLATLEILLLDAQIPQEHRVRLRYKNMRKLFRGERWVWILLHPYGGPLLRLLTSPRRGVHSKWIYEWRKMIEGFASINVDKQAQNTDKQAALDSNMRWLKLMRTKQKAVAWKESGNSKTQKP
jgi:hypothetical protein